MSKNEEQFYGMFRDAFEGFSPEVPAHIYDNVRAGMVRTGVAWKKWTAIALLLIGTGTLTLTFWPQEAHQGLSLEPQSTQKFTRISLITHTQEPAMGNQTCAAHVNQQVSQTAYHNNAAQTIGSASIESSGTNDSDVIPNSVVAGEMPESFTANPQTNNPDQEVLPSNPDPLELQSTNASEDKPAEKKIWPIKVKKTVTIED